MSGEGLIYIKNSFNLIAKKPQLNYKLGRGSEYTFSQSISRSDQWDHAKMLNITNHQDKANPI